MAFFKFFPPHHNNRDLRPQSLTINFWSPVRVVAEKILTQEMAKAVEAEASAEAGGHAENQKTGVASNKWLLPDNAEDWIKMFWPYPKEQFEWLRDSLHILADYPPLPILPRTIEFAFNQYCNSRYADF